jgi:hypothetical protein
MRDDELLTYVGEDDRSPSQSKQDLVYWVMTRVDEWRGVRETTFRDRWDEYYRIWRGRWDSSSRSRASERSKLIAPASQIAVDTAAAEILEATFARDTFIDINDDFKDQEREDAYRVRDQLIEDLRKDGIVETLAEIATLGAMYGQFIAKIVTDVEVCTYPEVIQNPDGTTDVVKRSEEKVKIYPVAIEPGNLVVDISSDCIDGGLGAAHEFEMPMHAIKAKQATNIYYDVKVGADDSTNYTRDRSETGNNGKRNSARITEYHGLVPLRMLTEATSERNDPDVMQLVQDVDNDDLIEAVVTIANGQTLLRAIANPSVMEDRAIVSEQFDTVPNRFWGRGVLEKGFNMQKALDSELRARSDGLAWTNNPMFAFDITRMPPGSDINAWPGKGWGMNGNPRESIMPLQLGAMDGSTFQQASELERMLQFATGAVDPSVLNGGVRDQASGASAVNVSGIVKRNKRTMLNLETFLTKLVRRIAWRKMQYDPKNYPMDYEFVVRGTIGIMSREIEQAFLTQMLQFVDKGTPEYFAVLQSMIDNSSTPFRAEMKQLIAGKMQPPPPEEVEAQKQKQQQMEQLQMQTMMEQLRNVQADTALKLKTGGVKEADAILKRLEAEMMDDQMAFNAVKANVDVMQAKNQERQINVTERKQDLEEAKFASGD